MGQRVEVYNPDGTLLSIEDTRSLSQTKTEKKELVNMLRENKIESGYRWNGNIWDIDPNSMAILSNYCTAISNGIELPVNFTWRSKENVNVPMTAQELIQLNALLINYINSVYNYSWYLKETIDSFTANFDIDDFNIEIGWP